MTTIEIGQNDQQVQRTETKASYKKREKLRSREKGKIEME